jgi:hypothetical protein
MIARFMQVYGANALTLTTATPATRRRPGGSFMVAEDSAQAASAAGAVRSVASIDALLALQGVEDATERRKRGVRRGRAVLDALDEVKLGLLSGALEPENLRRLKAAAGDMKGDTGDPQLDAVLAEILLRADVELAKAGIR